ncbi:MAG: hypothetical protein JW807_01745 [Spirochaetes bacterium]|nr:hypothetical protein [Spirochaetota bacterium]
MKQSRMRSYYIVVVFCLIAAAALSSCSDSESRLPFKSDSTKVIIDLGSKPKSGDMRLSAAPTGITSIKITVTGPGMALLERDFSPLNTVVELNIPSGLMRVFRVVVRTSEVEYVGTAVWNLGAGQTVSVPVAMLFSGYLSEGTPGAPIVLETSGTYVGRVGTGKSYYMTNYTGFSVHQVSLYDMSDDADLISYGEDSTFTSYVAPNFGLNLCGLTESETEEYMFDGTVSKDYYFVVDGSHTKHGATFIINTFAHNGGLVGPTPPGTPSNPRWVAVGRPYSTSVTSTNGYLNYYYSDIEMGREYSVNLREIDVTNQLSVYQDQFVTEYATNPFTAADSAVYFMADNSSGGANDNFYIEVVASEGSAAGPVEIFADESYGVGRAHYCMVCGNGSSSYYRMQIANRALTFNISATQIFGDIDLYVYDNPSFTGTPLGSSTNGPQTDETVIVNGSSSADGYFYIRIDDMEGAASPSGSTFILSAIGS